MKLACPYTPAKPQRKSRQSHHKSVGPSRQAKGEREGKSPARTQSPRGKGGGKRALARGQIRTDAAADSMAGRQKVKKEAEPFDSKVTVYVFSLAGKKTVRTDNSIRIHHRSERIGETVPDPHLSCRVPKPS